jgi:hypothetical protein
VSSVTLWGVQPLDAVPTTPTPLLDDESRAWVRDLGDGAPGRDEAFERVHGLLLRGARFEGARRPAAVRPVRGTELGQVAPQAADESSI